MQMCVKNCIFTIIKKNRFNVLDSSIEGVSVVMKFVLYILIYCFLNTAVEARDCDADPSYLVPTEGGMKTVFYPECGRKVTSPDISRDSYNQISNIKLCKAAISKIMGRSPHIIRARGNSVVHLAYVYGKQWDYKCRVEGNRIIWGASDGRWRIHHLDPKLTFTTSSGSIRITETFTNGTSSQRRFSLNDL